VIWMPRKTAICLTHAHSPAAESGDAYDVPELGTSEGFQTRRDSPSTLGITTPAFH
jgi:hypothetical protein